MSYALIVSETVLTDQFELRLTVRELAQLHQALAYNNQNPSYLLAHRLDCLVTDNSVSEKSLDEKTGRMVRRVFSDYCSELQSAVSEFYSEANSDDELVIAIPSEFRKTALRSLNQAAKGIYSNGPAISYAYVKKITKISPELCADLHKRIKATPDSCPELPSELLPKRLRERRESAARGGDPSELVEALDEILSA